MNLGRILSLTAWAAIGAAWALPPALATVAPEWHPFKRAAIRDIAPRDWRVISPADYTPPPPPFVATPAPYFSAGFYKAGELPPVLTDAEMVALGRLPFAGLPPKEFDHRTAVAVRIMDAPNEVTTRQMCNWPEKKPGDGTLIGCALQPRQWPPDANVWTVILGPETDLLAYGMSRSMVIRHEVGHVNGWPGDHAGATNFASAEPGPAAVAQVEATPVPKPRPAFEASREVASAKRMDGDRPNDVAALRLGGPLGGLLDLFGVQPLH